MESALAILGRGMVLVVIAHLAAGDGGRSGLFAAAVVASLTTITLADARAMLRYDPRVRLQLPADMQEGPAAGNSARVYSGFDRS